MSKKENLSEKELLAKRIEENIPLQKTEKLRSLILIRGAIVKLLNLKPVSKKIQTELVEAKCALDRLNLIYQKKIDQDLEVRRKVACKLLPSVILSPEGYNKIVEKYQETLENYKTANRILPRIQKKKAALIQV